MPLHYEKIDLLSTFSGTGHNGVSSVMRTRELYSLKCTRDSTTQVMLNRNAEMMVYVSGNSKSLSDTKDRSDQPFMTNNGEGLLWIKILVNPPVK